MLTDKNGKPSLKRLLMLILVLFNMALIIVKVDIEYIKQAVYLTGVIVGFVGAENISLTGSSTALQDVDKSNIKI